MRENAKVPRQRDVRQGLIARMLTMLSQGIAWLVFSLMFSILVEWVGMMFWWPEEGLDHSRKMLVAEIGHLQSDFGRSLVSSDPAWFAKTVADRTHYVLFEFTRVADFIEWESRRPASDESEVRSRLRTAFKFVVNYVLAAMQVAQVFAVRLAVLALASPVFVMFGVVAAVDGLVQRDLRRWSGGRESSFVYHWAKRSATPLFVLAWITYLALPISLHPSLVVLPFVTLFAISIALTASTFKKYL